MESAIYARELLDLATTSTLVSFLSPAWVYGLRSMGGEWVIIGSMKKACWPGEASIRLVAIMRL